MSLSFDRTFDPPYGEAVPVAPHVLRITAPNAGPMTFRGTNTYLVGETRPIVVDPGPEDASHLAAILAAIADRPVAAILVTHGHHDHRGLVAPLKAATGAPVLAARSYGEAVDVRLTDGDGVAGSEQRIETIETPGHSGDHLSFALPDLSLILTGDHVMAWSTTVVAPPDGRMRDYMDSLDRLAARPETRYLPGHGGPVEDPQPLLRGLRVHRRMRETAILERLSGGTQDISSLMTALYRDLRPELRPAAALSILAHLTDLVERGRAVAPEGLTLEGRYGPSPALTPPA